jgi:hypothetical protein
VLPDMEAQIVTDMLAGKFREPANAGIVSAYL